jgi:hypothetical protein
MTVFDAWRDGIRRVNRAPVVLIGVWVMTVLVSLPLAAAMRGLLRDHLGASLAADSAAAGINYDWMQEFSSQASGVGVTFGPAVVGFAAVLDNLSAFLDNTPRPLVVAFAAATYLGLWMFVAGGIIDRYARDRATRTVGFFASCGAFFFRFLRLAAIQWVVYALLFGVIHHWLFDRLYSRLTHEMSVERTAFIVRVVLYVVFGILVAACTTVFDYAKVRAVVEDRRSMVSAVAQAIGFIQRNAAAVILLFLANFGLFVAVVAAYAMVAPNSAGAGFPMWSAFIIGQAYVVARLWVKLVFWASEIALFQSLLAHSGYVNRPEPTWPESPIADALS